MASSYAKILVDFAKPPSTLFHEVTEFNDALSPKFLKFLKSPQIADVSKNQVIDNLNLDSNLTKVIKVALLNKSYIDIQNLAKDYESYLQSQFNLKIVTIEYATDVEKLKQEAIISKIKLDNQIDHIIVSKTTINPNLISGFRMRSINNEYNYSIAGELEKRKKSLIKEYHVKNA